MSVSNPQARIVAIAIAIAIGCGFMASTAPRAWAQFDRQAFRACLDKCDAGTERCRSAIGDDCAARIVNPRDRGFCFAERAYTCNQPHQDCVSACRANIHR